MPGSCLGDQADICGPIRLGDRFSISHCPNYQVIVEGM